MAAKLILARTEGTGRYPIFKDGDVFISKRDDTIYICTSLSGNTDDKFSAICIHKAQDCTIRATKVHIYKDLVLPFIGKIIIETI